MVNKRVVLLNDSVAVNITLLRTNETHSCLREINFLMLFIKISIFCFWILKWGRFWVMQVTSVFCNRNKKFITWLMNRVKAILLGSKYPLNSQIHSVTFECLKKDSILNHPQSRFFSFSNTELIKIKNFLKHKIFHFIHLCFGHWRKK